MRFAFLISLVFSACLVQASLLVPDPACVRDKLDRFDPGQRFSQGKFAGECADVSTVRAAEVSSENAGEISLRNFYHDGRFWTVVFPKGAVVRAYFQIIPFDSGVPLIKAAHTQLRFILDRDAELVSQNSDTRSKTRDVIVTSTFLAPLGVEYAAISGLRKSYAMVTRAMTSYARGLEEIVKDKSTVRQFEMKLSPEQKNELFLAALRRASADGYSQEYKILSNNCTTLTFDIVDGIHPPPAGVPPMRGSVWRLRDEFEGPSIDALRARGLIDDGSERPPMNTERSWP